MDFKGIIRTWQFFRQFWLLAILMFNAALLFSQQEYVVRSLDEKIQQNSEIGLIDPELFFNNVNLLLEEAVRNNDRNSELRLINQKCWYYNHKMDLDKSLETIRELHAKVEYGDVFYQAVVHQNYSHVYALSRLPEKSISEFKKSIKILNGLDGNDQQIIMTKIRAYQSVANAYSFQKDHKNEIKTMLLIEKETNKLNDINIKIRQNFNNFSNLGVVYMNLNSDSAEYYALKSMEFKKYDEESSIPQFKNYLVLGISHQKRNNLSRALDYYEKAESLTLYLQVALLDMQPLYEGMTEIYTKTNNTEKLNLYSKKLSDVKLEIETNKNKSLHSIIDNKILEDKTAVIYTAVGLSLIILILLISLFYFRRKYKRIAKKEKVSSETSFAGNEYSKLIEMVKKNDPAFIIAFHEVFPDFTNKLKAINDKIVPSEVEFCALLKLNLSTKEIAQYKTIEPKSAQIRKYRMRKKLNIPDDEDIYFWFNQF